MVQLGLRTILLVSLLCGLTVLLSGQPAFAYVGSAVYAPGTYRLLLGGHPKDVSGKPVTIPPKLITLTISRDSKKLTFRFEWTHTPGSGALLDHFLFLVGFDLNHNGIWENIDNGPQTIDDTLVLWYLGYDIVTPDPCWICPNIPKGFRVFSWGGGEDTFIEVMGPGPNDSVVGPWGASFKGPGTGKSYSYTLTFTVPLDLFADVLISGFGFGLIQETALKGENHNLVWVWPAQPPGTVFEEYGKEDGSGAALLGDLFFSTP